MTVKKPVLYEKLRYFYNEGRKGLLTNDERNEYIKNYMNPFEKEIGKPLFEMTQNEKLYYEVLSYNAADGTLKGYYCPICKNKGHLMYIVEDRIYEKDCQCRKIRQNIFNIHNSEFGELLNLYALKNYKIEHNWQRDILMKAINFIKNCNNQWFSIFGESGSGKSMICVGIVREFLKLQKSVLFMSWIQESVSLKQCVNDYEQYQKRISQIKNTEVLYIDDFFKNGKCSAPSSADIRLANEILNYRYNLARSNKSKTYITIISSECYIEQILSYDVAIGGRIIEMSSPDYLITIKGSDKNYRVKK